MSRPKIPVREAFRNALHSFRNDPRFQGQSESDLRKKAIILATAAQYPEGIDQDKLLMECRVTAKEVADIT